MNSHSEYLRMLLAGLILIGIAGFATVWWAFGLDLAVGYAAGFSTPIAYLKLAPTYTESEDTDEPPIGYQ